MAFTSGTAANYKGLLAAMVTFATANGWVALEQSETKVYMKGTGLSGLDEIYVGVETFENTTSGIYNWVLYGSWGYRAGREYSAMPGTSHSSAEQAIGTFWNAAIDYWIAANPRRIILCAKVGSTYQMIHLGLLTTPATEAQYPYPLCIAGPSKSNSYGYASTNIAAFWGESAVGTYGSGVRIQNPAGAWAVFNTSDSSSEAKPLCGPTNILKEINPNILTGLDGTYLLDQVYIQSRLVKAIYGYVDGLYRVTGYNNTSENIVTVDGVNYMCFQDTFRTGFGDYCAMRMA